MDSSLSKSHLPRNYWSEETEQVKATSRGRNLSKAHESQHNDSIKLTWMKTLLTGAAGFIGMSTALRLLARGEEVLGIDNLNDYYDVQLKADRLERLRTF